MRFFGGTSTFGRQSAACTCLRFCPHGLHHGLPLTHVKRPLSSVPPEALQPRQGEVVRVPGLVMAKGATKSTCFAPFLASASESQPAGWRLFLKLWTPGSEASGNTRSVYSAQCCFRASRESKGQDTQDTAELAKSALAFCSKLCGEVLRGTSARQGSSRIAEG